MFCPQCGTAPTPGGRFCGNCGVRLPVAAAEGAARQPGKRPTEASGVAVPAPVASSSSTNSAPAFTLTVVACVIAFGVVFAAASAVLRGLAGDASERETSAQARAPHTPQGAMGALLSGSAKPSAEAPRR
ncbi:MAG: zinc ribbon domain-containing protein [Casimicrobiaceae bacterium]